MARPTPPPPPRTRLWLATALATTLAATRPTAQESTMAHPQDQRLQDTVALARDFEAHHDPQQLRAAMLALQGVQLDAAASPAARLALRRDVMVRWLGLLLILERARDPAWRADLLPTLGTSAPRAPDGSQRPGAEVSADNRRQAERYEQQLQLQQLDGPMTERAESFVRSAYGFAPAERDEARGLIERAALSPARQHRLLQACYCRD